MMSQAQRPSEAARHVVELTEWDQVGPTSNPRLKGCSLAGDPQSRRLVETLNGRLDIREGYEGLEIATTSFVGRVDVGPLRISITPKLPKMPLARLLHYAYGLREISAIEETQTPTTCYGLHDLLIALLAAEVEELLHRGLACRYIGLSENLESPRGRLLVDEIIRQGGVREAKLPCRHFERRINWRLNQILRTGLETAGQMAEDRDLRRHVYKLSGMFRDVERPARLNDQDLDKAEHELTRLTTAYRPALTIIRLLHDALGVAFDPTEQPARMPGFLFDMNAFFQRLLSRFLHSSLVSSQIVDELSIRNLFAYSADGNPKRRSAPAPRPDYALFRGHELCGFLDAKYRDIWERGLPAEWLYQLSLYALASPSHVSVLLYASMGTDARDERVEVRQPILWSDKKPASVIIRPVPLAYIAELLEPTRVSYLASARRDLADKLVSPRTQSFNLVKSL